MTLKQFRDVLLTVTDKVYHFESSKEKEYIVWGEIGQKSLRADGNISETGIRIAVDIFTADEYSELPGKLTKALSENDEIFLRDCLTDFEKDTGYIHYAYTCEVV